MDQPRRLQPVKGAPPHVLQTEGGCESRSLLTAMFFFLFSVQCLQLRHLNVRTESIAGEACA
jgi:hypothetical protein